ncbi:acyltransferase family protein [Terrabacter terrigena]|uniref:Acyltransferase family protein n=1 Tax=Terrabacter terrigena TaxID=574718 RepID=A0ABW3MZN6_9MICO
MTQVATWVLGRRPALDGLRGLAILLVLCHHLQVLHMDGAGAGGVTVFFTLSGFLITALLLEERERVGRINLRRFYERRARRLLPALILSTALVLAFAPVFRPIFGDAYLQPRDLPAVIFYYGNWIEARPHDDIGVLGATWSLAVEEQFYLVWPLAVIAIAALGRRQTVMLVALLGAAVSLLVRVELLAEGASKDRIYYASDTTAFAILLGCALAAWLGTRRAPRPRWVYTVAGMGLVILPSWWVAEIANRIAPPIVAVGAVLLLVNIAGDRPRRVLELPVLRWFGTRSYGLYLYHAPLFLLLARLYGWSGWQLAAGVLPLSFVLAEWSYRRVEMPWRRGPSAAEAAPAGTAPAVSSGSVGHEPRDVVPPRHA